LSSPGLYLDKIIWMKINVPGEHTCSNPTVAATLSYGGTSFVRNPNPGIHSADDPTTPEDEARADRVVDEMTAWSTRFFYYDPGRPFANPPIPPRWRFKDAQTAVVNLNLCHHVEQPESVTRIEVFKERSVAATEWRLVIDTIDDGEVVFDPDEAEDIEILFYHTAKDRL
jgi:hypothetical protein